MIVSIENEFLKADIKTKGAELCALVDKGAAVNYIWKGDPAFWGKHSPVLFPIVGALKNELFYYDGKPYQLSRHGFARDLEFQIAEQSASAVTFLLESDEQTLRNFPFAFRFKIGYTLHQKELKVSYQVINPDKQPLLFSVGGHPAFAVPSINGTCYEDYYLEFEHEETAGHWPISPEGLIEEAPVPLLSKSKILRLSKPLFHKDALVFKQLRSQKITLTTDKAPGRLEFSFPGFPYLGIWAAKNADFVCIEPWCGIADSVHSNQQFADKEGINVLASAGMFERSWSVKVI